jgi:hypothetical protein
MGYHPSPENTLPHLGQRDLVVFCNTTTNKAPNDAVMKYSGEAIAGCVDGIFLETRRGRVYSSTKTFKENAIQARFLNVL